MPSELSGGMKKWVANIIFDNTSESVEPEVYPMHNF